MILKVKEWLQNLGIGDHAPIVQDEDVDEVQLHQEESAKNRLDLLAPFLAL